MTKLVNAKCPSCGASLKLSKDDDVVKCEYCESSVIVDEAIACFKLKISGNISVDGITSNSELIDAANELLGMNEYLKAKRKFLEFSEKCPDNYQGWLGLLICRTRNFTIRDNNIMFEKDVDNYYEHFLRVAPDDVKDKYYETIDRYFDPDKYARLEAQEKMKKVLQEAEKLKNPAEEKIKIKHFEGEKKKIEIIDNPNLKVINEFFDKGKNVFLIAVNAVLYFFGGCFILMGLLDDATILENLLTILIGLSLFKCVYSFVGKKFKIDKKYLFMLRFLIPFILIIILGSYL